MASTAQLNSLPITPVLTEFTDCMDRRKTPAEVLDTLHTLASKYLCISVLGAARVVCVKSCKLIMGSGKAIPAEPPSLFHKH
jgi:hypothetical protein